MHEGSRRAIVAAFAANLGIAASKLIVFFITGAASLLAEAIHSFADTGNQALLFLGGRRAARAPTREHPFGFGRERYFWAFVVAVVLFTAGGVFHPETVTSTEWALGTLVVAIVLESLSFRTAAHEAAKIRAPGTSWPAFIRESKNPEITVVLLEDTAALIGLNFALIGILLSWATGNDHFDAAGSIAIGILLGVVASVLAREMKSFLIGESAGPGVEQRIREAITAGPEVRRIIHLRTAQIGPDEVFLGAKLDIDAPSIEALAQEIDRIEARVRDAVPEATVIYIEPDLYRKRGAPVEGDARS
jgi:cation diffusion facilitator family transporter